ncbi:MAG: SDR family oxidoreductase [Planctomycetes bacterium]|nr:SDR family oxidoreductase [Planctomycetota bacterium]
MVSAGADSAGLFRLDGRTAVVTGACGKLGPVWIGALLDAGARVAGLDLAGVRPPPPLEDLLARHGKRLALLPADVTDRRSLEAARDSVESRFGPAGILVNNAGIDQPPGPARTYRLEEVPEESCRRVLEVNVLGLFLSTQAFLPSLQRAGRASVVNIGSLYGAVSPDARLYSHIPADPPFLKPPMYGASKAAVSSLTRYLAAHLAPEGVRVNTLCPGGVLGAQDEEFQRKFRDRVPLGRMATLGDLVGPLLFLASDASSYVTGHDLMVDGGFTAW